MYQRHKQKPPSGADSSGMTTLAKGGLNLKDLAEFLNPSFALENENYFVTNNRGLSKRKGLIKLKEIVGNSAITLIKYWKGYFILGYNTTITAYNEATDTVTPIKINWATAAAFSGCPYGNFFLVGNTGNKIHYITESAGVFTITEIAGAPQSGVITAIGARLYAGVGTDVYYCNIDDGSDPPFQTWTPAAIATGGGIVSFRNAGIVNAIASLGDTIIAFGATGKWAFRIITQNDGTGTIVKLEQVVMDRIDMGGASGAITTPKGLFYVNSAGLWQMMSMGQSNIAFSDQEQLVSVNLGTDYFKNIDLSNCDLAYFQRYSSILITCAKQSASNNHVITYNHDMQAFSTFRNWNINRWLTVNNEVYGASSIKTAIYHCFSGNTDDGVAISTRYLQELKMNAKGGAVALWTRQMLCGGYVKGLLHPTSEIEVGFDIYNRNGETEENKLGFTWTAQSNLNKADGFGTGEYGKSSWGGDKDSSDLVESFDGFRQFIRNFLRIRIRITESSKVGHQLDWISLETRQKTATRRRKMILSI